MNCDRYKNAVLEAAAANAELDVKIAVHVEGCPRCRATLEAERELFSHIDSTLRGDVNVEPRVSFLAQVRVQLLKGAPGEAESSAVWAVPGAVLALVLIAMFSPLINPHNPSLQGHSNEPSVRAEQSAAVTQAQQINEVFGEPVRRHSKKRVIETRVASQEPEILVPPDEQKAFAQFVRRVSGRDAMAEAVVSRAADQAVAQSTELPQVSSVDIADLQLDQVERDKWLARAGDSE